MEENDDKMTKMANLYQQSRSELYGFYIGLSSVQELIKDLLEIMDLFLSSDNSVDLSEENNTIFLKKTLPVFTEMFLRGKIKS